jgi:hypothetical protein
VRPHFLISFAHWGNLNLDRYFAPLQPVEVFADSGAFSAMTVGATVTVAGYGRWLSRWRGLFTTYANMDVIGDAEGTWRNQQRLEDAGLSPLPVFHVREEWRWLDWYLEEGYDYIALGVAGLRRRAYFPWLVKAFSICTEAGARVHGFGINDTSVLWDLPFYSVDSTSFLSGGNWGQMHLFTDRNRIMIVANADAPRYGRLVRSHGGEPRKIALGPGHPDYHWRYPLIVDAHAFACTARYLRGRHGLVGPPKGYDEPGLVMFLAESSRPKVPVWARVLSEKPEP